MTEAEILHIHEMLYQYLMLLHQANPKFKFLLNTTHPQDLSKGYWFLKNRNGELTTSFYSLVERKLVFFLSLNLKDVSLNKSLFFYISGEKSHELIAHLQDMISEMGYFAQYERRNESGKFELKVMPHQNALDVFRQFIREYKSLIDNYLDGIQSSAETAISEIIFKKSVTQVESYRKKLAGRYDYKSIYSEYLDACKAEIEVQKMLKKATPKLPFAFTRLYVNDFQGIKEMVIDTISPDVQWIFLTGENGYGKTSILRAIATGLVGDESVMADLLIKSKIYINGISQYETFIYEPQLKTKSPISIPVAAYGTARYQLLGADGDMQESSKKTVTYSLFYDNGQLINIEHELINANAYNKPRFEFLVKVFKKIIPNLAEIKVILVSGDPQVQYFEQNDDGKLYAPVTLPQLAAGYRSVLKMIGDMMIRLSKYPNNSLEDLKGIVLIDEIDAHLHPKYQYQLPKLLSDLFPKIQFIITTHSPIPILSLPKSIASAVLTVNRNIENGITVDRKDDEIEIHRLNPNALLTSPIFGFQQLFAPDATAQEIIATDNYDDVTAIQEMKKRLKSLREQGLIH